MSLPPNSTDQRWLANVAALLLCFLTLSAVHAQSPIAPPSNTIAISAISLDDLLLMEQIALEPSRAIRIAAPEGLELRELSFDLSAADLILLSNIINSGLRIVPSPESPETDALLPLQTTSGDSYRLSTSGELLQVVSGRPLRPVLKLNSKGLELLTKTGTPRFPLLSWDGAGPERAFAAYMPRVEGEDSSSLVLNLSLRAPTETNQLSHSDATPTLQVRRETSFSITFLPRPNPILRPDIPVKGSPSPTKIATATATSTSPAKATPTKTPGGTATRVATATPTSRALQTATATPSNTRAPRQTQTPRAAHTQTPRATSSPTAIATATKTPTPRPTTTAAATATRVQSPTPTPSASPTITATRTSTPTRTPTPNTYGQSCSLTSPCTTGQVCCMNPSDPRPGAGGAGTCLSPEACCKGFPNSRPPVGWPLSSLAIGGYPANLSEKVCCNTSSNGYEDSPSARDQIRLVDNEQGAVPNLGVDNLNRTYATYSILGHLRCLPSRCSPEMQNRPTYYPSDGRTNTTHCCRVACTGNTAQDFDWWVTGRGSACEPSSGSPNGNLSPYCLATPIPSPTPCSECQIALEEGYPSCSPTQSGQQIASIIPGTNPGSCRPGTCPTPTPSPTPVRIVLTEGDMRQRISDASLSVMPCHKIGATAERSFPPSAVARSTCYLGRCNSLTYQRQQFLNLEDQHYEDGAKVYYMPLFYKGGANEFDEEGQSLEDREVFVGWQQYRARIEREIYDASKQAHRAITRRVRQNPPRMGRPPSLNGDISPYILDPWAQYQQTYVVYEQCYKTKGPDPYKFALSPEDREGGFGSGDTVSYTAGDSPTLLGYIHTGNQELAEIISLMDSLETLLIVARDVTPLLGTACSAYQCAQTPSLVCLGEVGLDVVGDALVLVALGVPAKLTKIHTAAHFAQYATIPPSLALSAYHANNQDWAKAVGRAISPGVDLGVIAYSRGKIAYRSLRQKSKQLDCNTCEGRIDSSPRPTTCRTSSLASPPEGITENTRALAGDFKKYALEAHNARPTMIGVPEQRAPSSIVRLDQRSPQELASDGGWFLPNPGKEDYAPENAIWGHINPGAPGSSNLVSASHDFDANLALITEPGGFFAPRPSMPNLWAGADGISQPMTEAQEAAWRLYTRQAGRVNFEDDMWHWLTTEVQRIGWTRYRYTNADCVLVVKTSAVPSEAEVVTPFFKAGAHQEVTITAPVERSDAYFDSVGAFDIQQSSWSSFLGN